MPSSFKYSIYFMALALLLASSRSLYAEDAPSLSPDLNSRLSINKDVDELSENHYARQEFREEMQRIREQHEELETEHDTLKVQCMDAKGQDRTACMQRFNDLADRRKALHERIIALHEKMETQHTQHHAKLHKNNHQAQQVQPANVGHSDSGPAPAETQQPSPQ